MYCYPKPSKESPALKPRMIIYGIYMVLSIVVSLTVALIPAMVLFFGAFQNLDILVNSLGWPFVPIQGFFATQFMGVFPQFVFDHFWFLLFLVPIGFICYGVFLGILLGMFKLSRSVIPHLEDGLYSSESELWLLHEYHQAYYFLSSYFVWIFSLVLNSKIRHAIFGAKIGNRTIIGEARLFNPERIIIGDDCFIGTGSLVSAHVYEDGKLFLKTVKIGNNVTVGGNAVILPGVEIGDHAIIGASSVVPKNRKVPPYTVWFGHGKSVLRTDIKAEPEPHVEITAPATDVKDIYLEDEDLPRTPENPTDDS